MDGGASSSGPQKGGGEPRRRGEPENRRAGEPESRRAGEPESRSRGEVGRAGDSVPRRFETPSKGPLIHVVCLDCLRRSIVEASKIHWYINEVAKALETHELSIHPASPPSA